MANTLSFNLVADLLNDVLEQATGKKSIAPVDTRSFVSVAQTALLTGTDPLAQGISQVLDKTIFSVRPYYAKFTGMQKTDSEWGAWVRKVNYVDQPFVDDAGYPLTDGQSVDQYVVRKPSVLQLNFYGQNILQDFLTVTQDQLTVAFRGPDEFGEYMSGALQNLSDRHEQKTEVLSRVNLVNAITGVVTGGTAEQVHHLLTLYNAQTGESLTPTTVYARENFTPFMKWAYAYIQTVRDRMTERSQVMHLNVTGKPIQRHTPYDRQVMYMYAPTLRQMEARVLSGAFNEGRLEYRDFEIVNYWQSIETPDQVQGVPVYMGADGALVEGSTDSPVSVDNIFAVLADEEAMGIRAYSEGMYSTPMNARARYYDLWYNWRWQNFVDYTENIVVFTLD